MAGSDALERSDRYRADELGEPPLRHVAVRDSDHEVGRESQHHNRAGQVDGHPKDGSRPPESGCRARGQRNMRNVVRRRLPRCAGRAATRCRSHDCGSSAGGGAGSSLDSCLSNSSISRRSAPPSPQRFRFRSRARVRQPMGPFARYGRHSRRSSTSSSGCPPPSLMRGAALRLPCSWLLGEFTRATHRRKPHEPMR